MIDEDVNHHGLNIFIIKVSPFTNIPHQILNVVKTIKMLQFLTTHQTMQTCSYDFWAIQLYVQLTCSYGE
jgi:hypothetical protein